MWAVRQVGARICFGPEATPDLYHFPQAAGASIVGIEEYSPLTSVVKLANASEELLHVFVVRTPGEEYFAVWFENERYKSETHAHVYCGREHRLLLRLRRGDDPNDDYMTCAFRRVGGGWRVVFYEGCPKFLTVYQLPHGEQLFTGMSRVEYLGYSRTIPVSRRLRGEVADVVDRFHLCWSWLWGPLPNACIIDMQLVAEGIIDWIRGHELSEDIEDILHDDDNFHPRLDPFPIRKITGFSMWRGRHRNAGADADTDEGLWLEVRAVGFLDCDRDEEDASDDIRAQWGAAVHRAVVQTLEVH